MEIITRAEAKEKGLIRYFTGRPCKHGHITERLVSNGCIECNRIANQSPRQKERRKIAALKPSRKQAAAKHRVHYRKRPDVIERERRTCREARRKRYNFPTPTRAVPDVCEICGNASTIHLHLDHCHSTGKFRGWLCSNCNLGLGNFKDNINSLKLAIEYLEKSRSE